MKLLFLICGAVLLGIIVVETDITQALSLLADIGWGFIAIFVLYFIGFGIDAYAWQIATPGVPNDLPWLYRFYQIRLAGEAFNTVTPTASMGGEAVKAIMLKNHYGVSYRDATASLILAKTMIIAGLVAFLVIGFVMVWGSDKLDSSFKILSGAGLAAFVVSIVLFILVQRFKMTSLAGTALARSRWFARINNVLHHLHEVEDRLIDFYTRQPGRLLSVFALSFFNWIIGVFEIWVVMYMIGNTISIVDCWIIETVAQLVRSATFFIPASLGAQEGAFLLLGAAVTGQPSFGLTIALARRIREIVWSIWGLLVFYLLKPMPADPDQTRTD